MVHLAAIPSDAHAAGDKVKKPLVEEFKDKLNITSETDTFTSSVYGSRFAAEDLPKYEMPETEMPKEVAARMIKDDLNLDGNPQLK